MNVVVDTGYRELDDMIVGFKEGELIILASRPAIGKTSFALNVAQNVLNNDLGVVIFSLEMMTKQLMLRILSAKSSIPLQKLHASDLDKITITNQKLFVEDDMLDIDQIRSKLIKLKSQHHEISLCIIDYLQLIDGSGSKERNLEVGDILRELKLLTRELKMPIILLSQLDRKLESRNDKRPMLSDIREFSLIEQYADVIIFIYRDELYRMKEEIKKEKLEEDAEVIIGKNRNEPIGVVKLIFQKQFVRFAEQEKQRHAKKIV